MLQKIKELYAVHGPFPYLPECWPGPQMFECIFHKIKELLAILGPFLSAGRVPVVGGTWNVYENKGDS